MKNAYNFDYKSVFGKHKVAAIITSIIMLALGVLMIVLPFSALVVFIWIFVILAALAGLGMIIKFIVGKPSRNAAEFILGILILLLAVGLIIGGVVAIQKGTFQEGSKWMCMFLGVFFGIFLIIGGIYSLCTLAVVEPGRKGAAIAGSVLSIIIGGLALAFPLAGIGAYMIVCGVWFIVTAIAIIAFVCASGSKKNKDKKTSE